MDILCKTFSLLLLSAVIAISSSPFFLFILFMLALVCSVRANVPKKLIFFACFLPVLPICISHFVIEPIFGERYLTVVSVFAALTAWFRVTSLAFISLAWLLSIKLEEFAQLVNLVPFSQKILAGVLILVSAQRLNLARWRTLKELSSLYTEGQIRARTRPRFRDALRLGLPMMLASFATVIDVALSADGRGIGRPDNLAVPPARISASGLAIAVLLTIASGLSWHLGLLNDNISHLTPGQ